MKKTSILMGIIFTLLLSSCVLKTAPENDVGFTNVEDIKQFNGCYINLEDGQEKSKYSTRLSKYLWTNEKIEHQKIMTVCVNVLDKDVIEVKAKSDKKTLHVKRFIKDKDFSLKSGRITFSESTSINREGIAGVGIESLSIGLDQRGDGKITDSGVGAGIALLIPFVIIGEDSHRFLKIN